jgi:antitoxin MazE
MLKKIGARAGDQLDISIENGRIVIATLGWHPREGWAESAAAIAAAGEDGLVWPEFGNEDDENLTW